MPDSAKTLVIRSGIYTVTAEEMSPELRAFISQPSHNAAIVGDLNTVIQGHPSLKWLTVRNQDATIVAAYLMFARHKDSIGAIVEIHPLLSPTLKLDARTVSRLALVWCKLMNYTVISFVTFSIPPSVYNFTRKLGLTPTQPMQTVRGHQGHWFVLAADWKAPEVDMVIYWR